MSKPLQEPELLEIMRALPAVDWADFEAAARITGDIAQRLGEDPQLLRALVERVPRMTALRNKCECHSLDDKIVIWDEPGKGLRIRLRLANETQYERIHNHRYSFTAYILRGAYRHTLYTHNGMLDEHALLAQFQICSVRKELSGDCITLHHEQLHTTISDPWTLSLMIQSPAQKDRAFMIKRDSGQVWWRVGEAEESSERRAEVYMSDSRFGFWMQQLRRLGVC